jgi:hypothetical protein
VYVPQSDRRVQGTGEHVSGWWRTVRILVPERSVLFVFEIGCVAAEKRLLETVVAGLRGAGSDAAGVVVFFVRGVCEGGFAFVELEFGGEEEDLLDLADVAFEDADAFAGVEVPESDGEVVAGGEEGA